MGLFITTSASVRPRPLVLHAEYCGSSNLCALWGGVTGEESYKKYCTVFFPIFVFHGYNVINIIPGLVVGIFCSYFLSTSVRPGSLGMH